MTQAFDPSNVERFAANRIVYNRVFIPYGITYQRNEKWAYALDIRKGFGFQHVIGGQTNYIKKSSTYVISFRRTIAL